MLLIQEGGSWVIFYLTSHVLFRTVAPSTCSEARPAVRRDVQYNLEDRLYSSGNELQVEYPTQTITWQSNPGTLFVCWWLRSGRRRPRRDLFYLPVFMVWRVESGEKKIRFTLWGLKSGDRERGAPENPMTSVGGEYTKRKTEERRKEREKDPPVSRSKIESHYLLYNPVGP